MPASVVQSEMSLEPVLHKGWEGGREGGRKDNVQFVEIALTKQTSL